jgi:hypothetical protein
MMLIILLIVFLPIWIAWTVYELFKSDLRYIKRVDKLKTGEVEAMLRRHQSALWIHGTSVLAIALALFWIFGIAGIITEVPFLLVLGAHLIAFNRFRNGINAGKSKRKNADISRLIDQDDFDAEAVYTIGDDGELVEVKERNHAN